MSTSTGPRRRTARRLGRPLPRSVGAAATRVLRPVDVHTVEAAASWARNDLGALRGVGPIALERLGAALAELGLDFAG